jgi:TetR/AcrR family transcriptional repressor of lmrAB and yxaGH operons
LSAATGLGRSSLYHHFPKGKEDMANTAMAAVGAMSAQYIIEPLSGNGKPSVRLAYFADEISKFYHLGSKTCLIDLFSIGDAAPLFQHHLQQRIQALLAALATLLIETGIAETQAVQRAEDALIAIQGALVVSRALGSTAPFQRIINNLAQQLLHG